MTIKIVDVITYLRPEFGWSVVGDEYEGINFHETKPFTKEEYLAAIPKAEAALKKAEAEKVAIKKSAVSKLAALGLTPDEVTAIIGA